VFFLNANEKSLTEGVCRFRVMLDMLIFGLVFLSTSRYSVVPVDITLLLVCLSLSFGAVTCFSTLSSFSIN
jgi:hypothetical protein